MAETSAYRDLLLKTLADPAEAKGYLNAVLEDYPEGFLKALRNVAQARRMSLVAEQAGMTRESLYRALSEDGNPTFETLTSVLTVLGLKMTIAVQRGRKPRLVKAGSSPEVHEGTGRKKTA